MGQKTLLIIALVIVAPIFLLVFHALLARLLPFTNIQPSNQKLAFYAAVVLNLPVLVAAKFIPGIDWSAYIYIFITVNSLSFFYFQIFNMSETARRIKVLIGIRSGKVGSLGDLDRYYDTSSALEIRLERLEELSQVIKLPDGKYVIKGHFLYLGSYIIPVFRKILGYYDYT
jgi:hypothetical protein